jgi:hypothetical protein
LAPQELELQTAVKTDLEIGIESGPTWGAKSALKRDPPQRTS